jgi:hypothetical protein
MEKEMLLLLLLLDDVPEHAWGAGRSSRDWQRSLVAEKGHWMGPLNALLPM